MRKTFWLAFNLNDMNPVVDSYNYNDRVKIRVVLIVLFLRKAYAYKLDMF